MGIRAWLERQWWLLRSVVGGLVTATAIAVGGWFWNHYGDGPSPRDIFPWLALALCIAVIFFLLSEIAGRRADKSLSGELNRAIAALRGMTLAPAPPVTPPAPVGPRPPKPWAATVEEAGVRIEIRVERYATPWKWWRPDISGGLVDAPGWGQWPYLVHVGVQSTVDRVLSNVSFRVKEGALCGAISEPTFIGMGDPQITLFDGRPVEDWAVEIGDVRPRGRWDVVLLCSQTKASPNRLLWWVKEGDAILASGGLPSQPIQPPQIP